MAASEPEYVAATFARTWWKALMGNTVALIKDAATLAAQGSNGRAHSLLVLAMEELAKARWLYEASEWEWCKPLGLYGVPASPAGDVMVPEGLRSTRRSHAEKLKVAEQFASGLGGFWDMSRRAEYYEPADVASFEATASQRNRDKQAGFYVDRAGSSITTPLEITADGISESLEWIAQVVEMHLIEDHTRQQDAPDASLIDSVQDLHWAMLQHAHPAEFAGFIEQLSGDSDADGDGIGKPTSPTA